MSTKQGKQTYTNDRKVYIKETAAIVGPREKELEQLCCRSMRKMPQMYP